MTHGPVGDSAASVEYEETEHSRPRTCRDRVGRGARRLAVRLRQRGHQRRRLGDRGRRSASAALKLGFAVASALLGAAAGALTAGRLADKIGRMLGDEDRRRAVPHQRDRHRPVHNFVGTNDDHYLAAERRLDAGGLPDRRRHRRRRRLGHRAGVHRRDLAAAHPRPARLAAAAGDRDRHLHVARWSTSCSRMLAGGSATRRCGWAWRPGAGCSSSMVDPGGASTGCWRCTIPESPRYLVAKHRIPEARKVLTMLLGEKNLDVRSTGSGNRWSARSKPSWHDLQEPTGGIYRNRVGRSRAVGLPAVRRHQRDLLLLQHPLGGRRIHRERSRSSSPSSRR